MQKYQISKKWPFFVEFIYEVDADSEEEAMRKFKEHDRECVTKGKICEEIDGHGLDGLDESRPVMLGISEVIL